MFYKLAVNYALRKMRVGKSDYRKIALDLYLESIDNGSLLNDGYLSPRPFSNIVKLAINTKPHDWTEEFINEKSHLLAPDTRQNTLDYNLAVFYYATKNYSAAQLKLLQVEFSDLQYYLGGRILLAKIYYENSE